MPGKKKKFTAKQDRMAMHVADSEKKRGMDPKEAKSVGYATVNARKGKEVTGAKNKRAILDKSKKQRKPRGAKRI